MLQLKTTLPSFIRKEVWYSMLGSLVKNTRSCKITVFDKVKWFLNKTLKPDSYKSIQVKL